MRKLISFPLHQALIVIGCSLALSACSGWYLRGMDSGSASRLNTSVYVSGTKSETAKLLEAQLEKSGNLASALDGQMHLTLGKENWQKRTATRTSTSETAEYQLTLNVSYTLTTQAGDPIPAPGSVTVYRTYANNPNDISGMDREQTLLRSDMQHSAARQIVQQIQFSQR